MTPTSTLRWRDWSGKWPAIAFPVAAALIAGIVLAHLQPGPGPIDLNVYRAAGTALWNGTPDIYAPDFSRQTGTYLPFTYPPIAALLAVPLAVFPLGVDFVAWTVVSTWLLARFVRRELRTTRLAQLTGLAVLIALTLWILPVTDTLYLGQLGILLTLGCIAGSTSRHSWPAIIIGVLAAVKLTPLLFVLYFAIMKQWGRLAWSAGAFVALTALGWAVLPAESSQYFTELIGRSDRVGDPGFYSNQSLAGATARIGLGNTAWLLLTGATLVGGLWLARRWLLAGSPIGGAIVVGLTTVLISPISWQHHAVWIVPALILIYKTRPGKPVLITLGVLLTVSVLRLPQWASRVDQGGAVGLLANVGMDAITLVVIALGVLMFICRPPFQPTGEPADSGR